MDPPPRRPPSLTFFALAVGFLGASTMPLAVGMLGPTMQEFPGGVGLVVGTAFLASNFALLVASIGIWWLREWGRQVAIAGLALRMLHGLVFGLAPAHVGTRLPTLVSVAVFGVLVWYLVRLRPLFAEAERARAGTA